MVVRSVMVGVGMMMALGCNSTIDVGTDDAGGAAENRDAPGSDAATDRGTSNQFPQGGDAADGMTAKQPGDAASDASALRFTYCTFTSDAGAPTCSAYAPWSTNAAETAQAQLDCMAVHGTTVSLCPSEALVGCCSLPLCPPPPPGQSGSCAFFGPEQVGMNVTCHYGEDAGTAHVQDLTCVAGGGTWTTTVPQ